MTARTTLAPWVPPCAYTLAGGVGVSSLVVSAVEIFGLATAVGFADAAAAALFVGVDLGAAAGAVIRVGAPDESRMATAGRVTTWLLVLASSGLNGLSVLARGADALLGPVGLLPEPVAIAVAFGIAVLFPIVAALMVELVLLVRTVPVAAARQAARPAARQEPRKDPVPVPAAPVPAPSHTWEEERPLRSVPAPVPERKPTKQEQAEDIWKRAFRAGEELSPAELNRRVSANGLLKGKHVEQWREEVAAEPAADTM